MSESVITLPAARDCDPQCACAMPPGVARPADADPTRAAEIQAIVEHGRRTRTPTPRWLWLAAVVVGAVCAAGFLIAMLDAREPVETTRLSVDGKPVVRRPTGSGGLGIGLAIGTCVGIVIGFSIARQRAPHSSRNSP